MKNIRRICMVGFAVMMFAVTVIAVPENVVLTEKGIKTLDTGAAIKSYRIADQKVVDVEKAGATSLRLTGLSAGSTDVVVVGPGGSQTLKVTVQKEDLEALARQVAKDLAEYPEVEVTVNRAAGKVIVKGEVGSANNLRAIHKALLVYDDTVNYDQLKGVINMRVVQGLKASLEDQGYKVVDKNFEGKKSPGVLTISIVQDRAFIEGQLYSRRNIKQVSQIVRSHRDLGIVGEGKEADLKDRFPVVLNLSVLPSMVEVDVAFISLDNAKLKQVGINLVENGLVAVDSLSATLAGTVGRGHTSDISGEYSINSQLAGVLKIFGEGAGVAVEKKAHLKFQNDATEWATTKHGGTTIIKTSGTTAGSVEKIEYGLIVKIKGGLEDAETAMLDLDLELSETSPVEGGDYNKTEDSLVNTIRCPLNRTMVVAGVDTKVVTTKVSGVPILKSIPLLGRLFSEKKDAVSDGRRLIIICPSISNETGEGTKFSAGAQDTIDAAREKIRKMEKKVY